MIQIRRGDAGVAALIEEELGGQVGNCSFDLCGLLWLCAHKMAAA